MPTRSPTKTPAPSPTPSPPGPHLPHHKTYKTYCGVQFLDGKKGDDDSGIAYEITGTKGARAACDHMSFATQAHKDACKKAMGSVKIGGPGNDFLTALNLSSCQADKNADAIFSSKVKLMRKKPNVAGIVMLSLVILLIIICPVCVFVRRRVGTKIADAAKGTADAAKGTADAATKEIADAAKGGVNLAMGPAKA